jgi:ribosomal protein S18 acetylase RimI-like enzyme
MGKLHFEAAGLVVAQREGQIVAFAHAGFGPAEPKGRSHRLDYAMGTVALVLLQPELDDADLERGLFLNAERYLRARGASVLYAGGQTPLNPFYWGIYGGSECSGILGSHSAFLRAATRADYQPVATTEIVEVDLALPEPKDPKGALLRRQFRLEVVDDDLPSGWWEALAIGLFRPTTFRLVDKFDDRPVARARTWDIASGFGFGDGRSRVGLIDLEVEPAHRHKGYGRHLVSEVLRHARSHSVDVVTAQTSSTNKPALGLYQSLGFEPVDNAALFRLPGELSARSDHATVEDSKACN